VDMARPTPSTGPAGAVGARIRPEDAFTEIDGFRAWDGLQRHLSLAAIYGQNKKICGNRGWGYGYG